MAKLRRTGSSVAPKSSKAKAPARPVKTGGARRARPVGRSGQKPVAASRNAPARAARPSGRGRPSSRKTISPKEASSRKQSQPRAADRPAPPSPRDLAVEVFERGFTALQQRKFAAASQLFASVLREYPDEKELQERARVYLAICRRKAEASLPHAPRTWEERLNAATVAINRAEFTEGVSLLAALEREDRDSDHVQYLQAIAYAGLGDLSQSLAHLGQAISLNWDNRRRATEDSDLSPLRDDPAFAALLAAPPAQKRRQTTRPRQGR